MDGLETTLLNLARLYLRVLCPANLQLKQRLPFDLADSDFFSSEPLLFLADWRQFDFLIFS